MAVALRCALLNAPFYNFHHTVYYLENKYLIAIFDVATTVKIDPYIPLGSSLYQKKLYYPIKYFLIT